MSFMKTAKSSSILIVLALPVQLFPLNLKQKVLHDFLRDENILRVMVDGHVFDSDKLVSVFKSTFFKGTVSQYKGCELLFLKSTTKCDECGHHARACPDGIVTACYRPNP